MKVGNMNLGRILGTGAMLVGLLGSTGCDEAAKQCGLTCPDQGVIEGNASITGYAGVDTFFQSVVSFKTIANGVAADIQAELDGIQGAFGISDKDLKASGGDLSAAIKAKLDATFKAKLTVKAQPAKCEIDAKLSIDAKADCTAKAGCAVTPGKLTASCMGTCEVDVNASGSCEAEAKLTCDVTAPSFACKGSCQGTCTAQLDVAATCDGKCNGSCSGSTDAGGKCTGMCQGSCELTGMAALNCSGSCNGTCTYEPATASCDASAKAHCDFEASASASCTGKCDGEFVPPKVDCEAEASCDASVKADAKFQAKCTPPSLDVQFTFAGDASARAQFDFAIADLKVRLPRLLAALKKAELVADAGLELGKDGAAAVSGSLDALTSDKVDVVAKFRIASCAPAELTASAKAISNASTDLTAQIAAAGKVTGAVGM